MLLPVVIIASYNRFSRISALLSQLFQQRVESSYPYKVILVDDASPGDEYLSLTQTFPELIYHRNRLNLGKEEYWRSINALLQAAKQEGADYVIQLDDDFQICDRFVDRLVDEVEDVKSREHGLWACHFHHYQGKTKEQWGLPQWLDGGACFTKKCLERIRYRLDPISARRFRSRAPVSSGVWSQISAKISRMGGVVYHTPYSFVRHLGNEDSQMNGKHREQHPIITERFLDDILET